MRYVLVGFDENIEKDAIYQLEKLDDETFYVKSSSEETVNSPEDFIMFLYKSLLEKCEIEPNEIIHFKLGELYQSYPETGFTDAYEIADKFGDIQDRYMIESI